MTSAGDPNPRARRGWTLLVALAALIAALVGVDAWLKRGSLPGVVLPNAEITLTATDLPSAWAALETSNTFGRIQTDAPDLRQRTGVWLRQQTGVRWTPLRWYVWFGRPLDVSI